MRHFLLKHKDGLYLSRSTRISHLYWTGKIVCTDSQHMAKTYSRRRDAENTLESLNHHYPAGDWQIKIIED